MENKLPRLPDDLINKKILIKLSVKDLLRYRSVCKEWKIFISSPEFASLHFNHSVSKMPAKEIISAHHVLPVPSNSVTSCRRHEYVVGSINGFLAVVVREEEVLGVGHAPKDEEVFHIWIWNPATGKSKKLPFGTIKGFGNYPVCSFGFGWDHVKDIYKLIKFIYGNGRSFAEVWSSDLNSWSQIELWSILVPSAFPLSFHPDKPISSSDVTVKGGSILYWVLKNNIEDVPEEDGEDGAFSVASYDMPSSVLKITPFPHLPVSAEKMTYDFSNQKGVFCINWKDNFALVESYSSRIQGNCTIWVLDAEHKTWTKEEPWILDAFSMSCLDSSEDTLVLLISKRLASCDIASEVLKFVKRKETAYVEEAWLYHDSLLSLKDFATLDVEWMKTLHLDISPLP